MSAAEKYPLCSPATGAVHEMVAVRLSSGDGKAVSSPTSPGTSMPQKQLTFVWRPVPNSFAVVMVYSFMPCFASMSLYETAAPGASALPSPTRVPSLRLTVMSTLPLSSVPSMAFVGAQNEMLLFSAPSAAAVALAAVASAGALTSEPFSMRIFLILSVIWSASEITWNPT